MDKQQEPTIIFGLGREGLSTVRHLLSQNPNEPLLLLDEKPQKELGPEWHDLLTKETITFSQTLPETLDSPLVYISPGIPPHNQLCKALEEKNATFTSNLELFCQKVNQLTGDVVTIGVTGTKGKSTTSALLYHLLKTAGFSAHYAGNVGIPALDILPDIQSDAAEKCYIVLELSSHQLRTLETSPDIAIVQNIVPEHLDYYDSFESYVAAKAQIAKHQQESDHIIYSSDFETAEQVASSSPAQKHVYSLENPSENHLSEEITSALSQAKTKLLGKHNQYNMAPSVVVGKLLGISPETIQKALESFQPLSHRLEIIPTEDGITYVNDSLATTPEATIAALEAFADRQVVLIAGGYDRDLDFFDLAKKIVHTKTIKAIILFPPTGEKIVHFMHKIQADAPLLKTGYFKVESMSEAVHTAKDVAKSGDVVLLSPAAASFGRFRDYADRGNQFKQLVQENV